MKLKLIILIFNAFYLIATIIWAISDKSMESIVAIVGGIVSFLNFFIANDNSFSFKQRIAQSGDNPISIVGDVKGSHIGHTTK